MRITRRLERVASAGIALVGVSRFMAYNTLDSAPHDSPGPLFLTSGGDFGMNVYAFLWLLVGVLALMNTLWKDSGWSTPLFVGLMTVWGCSYLGSWIESGFNSESWLTFCLYIGVAIYVLFDYLEGNRLKRLLSIANERGHLVATGVIPVPVKTEEGEIVEDHLRVRMEVRDNQ